MSGDQLVHLGRCVRVHGECGVLCLLKRRGVDVSVGRSTNNVECLLQLLLAVFRRISVRLGGRHERGWRRTSCAAYVCVKLANDRTFRVRSDAA